MSKIFPDARHALLDEAADRVAGRVAEGETARTRLAELDCMLKDFPLDQWRAFRNAMLGSLAVTASDEDWATAIRLAEKCTGMNQVTEPVGALAGVGREQTDG